MEEYKVVIHTNQYTGDFDRELTAHLVGIVGDCGVGEDYVKGLYPPDFVNIIESKVDDSGVYRPCSICPVDISLFSEDELKAIHKDIKSRIITEYQKYITHKLNIRKKLEAGEVVGSWTVEVIDKENARHKERIKLIEAEVFDVERVLYFAVEIYFKRRPTEEEISFIKSRLRTFGHEFVKGIEFKRIDIVSLNTKEIIVDKYAC